ncbi:MAG: diadenylate cyclase CdaA [Clostridia bacterium]|nr:diadenylate cyclase CdaA [Clostridia bacterium]
MREFFMDCLRTVRNISIPDVIDILCVTILLYFIVVFLRDKRAAKLVIGVIFLVILKAISDFFGMYVMQFILQNVFRVGLIIIAIIFQPELRAALEKVGGQPLKGIRSIGKKTDDADGVISSVTDAASELSETKTGALIVIERDTKLGDMVLTGTVIDAEPSSSLIRNIFYDKAPLHDGALIIRKGRLYAAGCLLPLSTNSDIIQDLGTRHRAAIGMSENSDAVVVVVSEETGVVSVAVDGVLHRGYSKTSLRSVLERCLKNGTNNSRAQKNGKKNGKDGKSGVSE